MSLSSLFPGCPGTVVMSCLMSSKSRCGPEVSSVCGTEAWADVIGCEAAPRGVPAHWTDGVGYLTRMYRTDA